MCWVQHEVVAHRQPTQRPLLAFGERHPVFDVVGLERVEQMLRLEGEVGLQHEDRAAVAEDWDLTNR